VKRFRSLTVFVEPDAVVPLMSAIESLLTQGWSRDKKWEQEFSPAYAQRAFCFICSSIVDRREVALVMSVEGRRLTVDNIVPSKGRLTIDAYNSVLAAFYLKFLHPAAAEAGLIVELSSDERTIEGVFSLRGIELLRRFSACANKSITHPADQHRWFEFLFHAYLQRRSKHECEEGLLARFLRDDGWRDDKVDQLISEYEFAGELLRELDRKEFIAPWVERPSQPTAPPEETPNRELMEVELHGKFVHTKSRS